MTRHLPDMRAEFDGALYCAIPAEDAEKALRDGVPDRLTYWAVLPLAEYYAEAVEDDGFQPVILKISLANLDQALLEPDHPGIEEPITTVLASTEDLVLQAWENSDQSWRASLDLIGSLRHRGPIAASLLSTEQ